MDESDFVLGRAHENSPVLFDLSPDKKISRAHARIWKEGKGYWLEDLQSSRGTRLNGVEITGMGKQRIHTGDVIVVGETTLRIESLELQDALAQTSYLENGAKLAAENQQADAGVNIARNLDATVFDPAPTRGAGNAWALRLRLICELPLQFAAKTELKELLPTIVDRLVELIPNGESWALALLDPKTNTLLLKAHRSRYEPHVSDSLSRRAIGGRQAFIWNRAVPGDISGTILQSAIVTGMYAPLLWQDEAFGVICAESRSPENVFGEEDLRLIVFMAQYAAMAVGSHRLQEKLRDESVLSAKLLRQFSPKVAERILTHRGHLRLGGEQSEVTILNWDIRGFTMLTREMQPDETVEMLNDYFAALVPIIFAQQGTIDKFMGDAILAVFGSPEHDPKQYEHAILAAVEMLAAAARVNESRRARGLPCAESGIGIHCGEVVHGFVGTADRMEFTVIGDVVNKAARYCTAAGGGQVLISPEVHERVWRIVQVEKTTIETKHEGNFTAYRVNGMKAGPEETRP
ncbi:MAG: adenylate/guanylate cyclase domain-containing protein [Candidatus Acidiferrales bacterium]